LSGTDVISALMGVVISVSLFLPWYGVAVGTVGVTASGLKVHPYLWVAFALCLVQLGSLAVAARAPATRVLAPVHREALLAELNVLTLALVGVAFFAKGSAAAGWHEGAVVALAAAGFGTLVKLAVTLSLPARARRT
jgi:hypothetical protein